LPIFRVLHKIGLTKKYDVNLDLHENYPVAIQNYLWATKFPNNVIVMPKLWFKIEKKLLKHANKIIVLSEDYKEKLIKNYPYLKYEQFVIFPNVPDLTRFKQRTVQIGSSANSHNVVVLTYFGIISRRRGIHTAIKALKILINSGQNLKLLLIGPIDKKEKNQFSYYLDDLNLKNYIQHIKWIDLDDLPAYMGKTDICISPIIKNDQHESGVANKVFQYMTFGKPVIVSNCKPQAKIIEQEECGVVFDSENPADLAEKIKTLISNTELIKKMGKNAKKAILRKYNTKVMGENLLNIYRI
jgi:glycosyltransferase involved in cell wall biosynthesis